MGHVFFNVSACSSKSAEKAEAYKVKVLEDKQTQNWAVKLICTPALASQKSKQSSTVIDIYSLNWEVDTSTSFINSKKTKNILKELKQIPAELLQNKENSQVLLVLDIKTKKEGYTNPQFIKEYEQNFIALFNQDKKPNYINHLISQGLQYIFLEGSLKADLLATGLFSPALNQYLQKNSSDFCEMIEFIINAFKRGENVSVKSPDGVNAVFKPENYIAKISKQIPNFKPVSVSYTIYPKSYYLIANEGKYTQAMKQSGFFSIKLSSPDSSKIVQMETEKVSGAAYVN